MSRTEVQKVDSIDSSILRAGSRLRHRALALLEGAMSAGDLSKSQLAKRLGVGRSAVGQTLSGNGNLSLQTLAEYLGVMGYEIELVPVAKGEVSLSMRERRAPRIACITLRDQDWQGDGDTLAVLERREAITENRRRLAHTRANSVEWGNFTTTSVDPSFNRVRTRS